MAHFFGYFLLVVMAFCVWPAEDGGLSHHPVERFFDSLDALTQPRGRVAVGCFLLAVASAAIGRTIL